MNKVLAENLVKKYNNDIVKMIDSKKLPAKAVSADLDNSDLIINLLVDILETEYITKVSIWIEDLENLFYNDAYDLLDERGGFDSSKYNSLTLARIRLLRIIYEAIEHLSKGWADPKGCYKYNAKLALGQKVRAVISSPGLMIYYN